MNAILKQIHNLLIKNNKTIAVAESCTGGLLSELLTRLSGSSQYFMLGVVAYSNHAKANILKIPAQIVLKKGAVSKGIAVYMAGNIQKIAKTDFGIGITGIAGPSGGSAKKPVGTVFIAIAAKNKTIPYLFRFKGSRTSIRKQATRKALELLKKHI